MRQTIFTTPAALAGTTAVLMLLLAAQPAAGQVTNPCTQDFKQVCSDITPGGGRLFRCYEERKEKMSPSCVAWAEKAKANAAVLQEACSKEIDSSCNFEKGDPFAMLDCLQGQLMNLSQRCGEKLAEFKSSYPKPVY